MTVDIEVKAFIELEENKAATCSFCKCGPKPCVKGQSLDYEFETIIATPRLAVTTIKDRMYPYICQECVYALGIHYKIGIIS